MPSKQENIKQENKHEEKLLENAKANSVGDGNVIDNVEKREEEEELNVLIPTVDTNDSLNTGRKSEKETLKNNDKNNNKEQQKIENNSVVNDSLNLSKNDVSLTNSNTIKDNSLKNGNVINNINNNKNVSNSNMERFKSDVNNIYADYHQMKIGSLLDKKYDKESEIKIDNLEEDFKKKLENDKEYQNAKKSARKSTAAMGVIAAIAISPAGAALLPFAAICIGVLFASSVYHTSKANKILQKHKDKMKKMEENIMLDKEIDKMTDPRLKQYYKYKEAIEREEKEIDDISKEAEKQKKEAFNEIRNKRSKSTEKNKNLSKDNNNVVNIKNNKQNAIVNDNIKKDDKAKDNNKKDVEAKNEKNNQNNKVEKKENLPNEAGKNKEKVDNVENKKEAMAGKILENKKEVTKNSNIDKDLKLKESIIEIKNNKEQKEELNKNVKKEKDIIINLNKDVINTNGKGNLKENEGKVMKIEISRDQKENEQQIKSGVETKVNKITDINVDLQ